MHVFMLASRWQYMPKIVLNTFTIDQHSLFRSIREVRYALASSTLVATAICYEFHDTMQNET